MKPISTIVLVLLVGYGCIRSYASLSKGYPWEEMDWNNNGSTSPWEFLQASDIGMRQVKRNGSNCKEYYAYKDGLTLKQDCDL